MGPQRSCTFRRGTISQECSGACRYIPCNLCRAKCRISAAFSSQISYDVCNSVRFAAGVHEIDPILCCCLRTSHGGGCKREAEALTTAVGPHMRVDPRPRQLPLTSAAPPAPEGPICPQQLRIPTCWSARPSSVTLLLRRAHPVRTLRPILSALCDMSFVSSRPILGTHSRPLSILYCGLTLVPPLAAQASIIVL